MRADRWMLLLWALFLLGLTEPVQAYDAGAYDIRSEYSANRTINTATHYSSSWSVSNSGSSLKIGKTFTMAAPGGRTVSANAAGFITKELAMKWAARAVAGASGLGTAVLIWQVFDAVRTHGKDASCGAGTDQLCFDAGQSTENVAQFCVVHGSVTFCADTLQGAMAALADWMTTTNGGNGEQGSSPAICSNIQNSCTQYQYRVGTCPLSGLTCRIESSFRSRVSGTWGQWSSWAIYGNKTATQSTQAVCPLNGQGQRPPTDWDGKCPTGQFGEPISFEEAAAKRAAAEAAQPSRYVPLTDSQYRELVEQALGEWPQPFESAAAPTIESTSPTPLPGPSTTTTGPNGSTTTATSWNFSPYGITKPWQERLSGPWSETTKVTFRDANGNVINEETTTTETDGATPGDAATQTCPDGSTNVACTPMGDVPEEPIPTRTESIDFEAESIGLPSGCPADIPLPGGAVLTYTQTCQAMEIIRPFIIAGAAFAGALMIVFALRR